MTVEELALLIDSISGAINAVCGVLVWPLVVFVLLLVFRQTIIDTFARGGIEGEFGPLKFSVPPTDELLSGVEMDAEDNVNWQKTGHLWWLCSDFRDAISAVAQGASRPIIIDRLQRVHHHAQALNLDEVVVGELRHLRDDAYASSNQDWTPTRREMIAHELAVVFNTVAQLAQSHDKDFIPNPD